MTQNPPTPTVLSAVVAPCLALDFVTAWSNKHQMFSDGPKGLWGSISSYDGSNDNIYFPYALPVVTVGTRAEDDAQLPTAFHQRNIFSWDEEESRDCFVYIKHLNGYTKVNSRVLKCDETCALHPGDEIVLGDLTYIYELLVDARELPLSIWNYYNFSNSYPDPARGSHKFIKSSAIKVQKDCDRRRVSIKRISLIAAPNARGGCRKEDFLFAGKELRMLQTLRHPNMVRCLEAFVHSRNIGALFLVCERERGLLLSELAGVKFAEDFCRQIAYQFCDVMAYLHYNGQIHGDLQPSNVMLTCFEPPRIKLVDLGSTVFDNAARGAPGYVGQEVQWNQPLHPVADSSSVACIIFELLTGHKLWHIVNDTVSVSVQIHERQWKWHQTGPTFSEDAQDWLMNLLRFEAYKRQTLTLMREHHWLAGLRPAHDFHRTLPYNRNLAALPPRAPSPSDTEPGDSDETIAAYLAARAELEARDEFTVEEMLQEIEEDQARRIFARVTAAAAARAEPKPVSGPSRVRRSSRLAEKKAANRKASVGLSDVRMTSRTPAAGQTRVKRRRRTTRG